jgi:hypothetical protein
MRWVLLRRRSPGREADTLDAVPVLGDGGLAAVVARDLVASPWCRCSWSPRFLNRRGLAPCRASRHEPRRRRPRSANARTAFDPFAPTAHTLPPGAAATVTPAAAQVSDVRARRASDTTREPEIPETGNQTRADGSQPLLYLHHHTSGKSGPRQFRFSGDNPSWRCRVPLFREYPFQLRRWRRVGFHSHGRLARHTSEAARCAAVAGSSNTLGHQVPSANFRPRTSGRRRPGARTS